MGEKKKKKQIHSCFKFGLNTVTLKCKNVLLTLMVLCTIKYILSDQQFLINKSPFICYTVQSFHKNVKHEFSDWARSEL